MADTFHWQDWPLAVTLTVPVEGELTKLRGEGLVVAVNVHWLVLDSVMLTTWPAISSVAFFTPPDPFPAAVTVTLPLPVPLVGETEAHAPVCKMDAVQAQPTPLALKLTVWLPPLAINNKLDGATVNEHALVPASETGIDCPATVIFPVRFCALELGSAEASTVPLPVPLVTFRLNQLSEEEAVHVHVDELAEIVKG
jgi:hypothetical protein